MFRRSSAAKRGLDPGKWFNYAEVVVAEKIGREVMQYVSTINKDYLACKLLSEQQAAWEAAKQRLGNQPARRCVATEAMNSGIKMIFVGRRRGLGTRKVARACYTLDLSPATASMEAKPGFPARRSRPRSIAVLHGGG